MNVLKIISVFLLPLLFLSCLKNNYDEIPIEFSRFGIYYPNTKIIKTDNNEELTVLNSQHIKVDEETPVRVLVFFIVDELIDDNTAKINITKIFDITAKLIIINEENKDSLLRNDPIEFYHLWIAQDYLTFDFIFWGNNKIHYFFVSQNPEEQTEDKIVLKLHHNANNDVVYSKFKHFISVPIKEFKNIYPDKDSVELLISIPENSNTTIKKSIWYKF